MDKKWKKMTMAERRKVRSGNNPAGIIFGSDSIEWMILSI
jgi:hypothetical protein